MELGEWMDVLRSEYLEDFVPAGGAAVKFVVVPTDGMAERVVSDVRDCGQSQHYLVAEVDASRTRLHLMQHLFYEVARQIPWEDLARQVVRRCYADLGYPIAGDDLRFATVAEDRHEDPASLGADLRRTIQNLVLSNSALAKDFRYAMCFLCLEQVRHAAGMGPDSEVILEWLRGDLKLINAVKKLLIFRKIGRNNGRAMLSSLGAWCRLAGRSGLVLLLDVRQFAVARRADVGFGSQYYSVAAVMDAYEVLRQLIDATDDLAGFLGVVVCPPELFDDEKRGVKVYKALYERVWPDVRLRRLTNPLSALATLEVAL